MPHDEKVILESDDICPQLLFEVINALLLKFPTIYTSDDLKKPDFAAGVLFGLAMFIQPDASVFETDEGHEHIQHKRFGKRLIFAINTIITSHTDVGIELQQRVDNKNKKSH